VEKLGTGAPPPPAGGWSMERPQASIHPWIMRIIICHTPFFIHIVQCRRSQHARTLTPMNTRTQILPL
jgi:hypothetical protein